MKNITLAATSVVALLFLLTVGAPHASADIFTFTSCHITGSSCDGGSVPLASGFGTVTLTQSGTSVNFVVVLNNGNTFVETGSGAMELFLFNDALAGSTITNIIATENGTTVPMDLVGLTNLNPTGTPPGVHADGTGYLTASVECNTANTTLNCNPGMIPTINDLHFTVTNATLAQLETANAAGNLFVADVLCGATQPSCTGGLTGPVDVSVPTVPDGGMTLMLLGGALVGVESLRRRIRA